MRKFGLRLAAGGLGLLLAAEPAQLGAQEAATPPEAAAEPGLLEQATDGFLSLFGWGDDPPEKAPGPAPVPEVAAPQPAIEAPESQATETEVPQSPVPEAETADTEAPGGALPAQEMLPAEDLPLAGAEPLDAEPLEVEGLEAEPLVSGTMPAPATPEAAKPDPIVLPAAGPDSSDPLEPSEKVIILIRDSGVVLNAPWPPRKPDVPMVAAAPAAVEDAAPTQSAALPAASGSLPSPEEEAAALGLLLPTIEPAPPAAAALQPPQPPQKKKAKPKARPAATGETQALGSALKELMKSNPVVARVEGENLRWADVMDSAADLPERYKSQVEAIFPALLDRMVDLRLLAKAAADSGISDEAEIRALVKKFEDNLLREIYIRRQVTNQIRESDLRARYDTLAAEAAAANELRARHILLDSEAEAQEVIQQLDQGADFAALAEARSAGPSAKRGGDLGYFDPARMVPEFAQPLNSLPEGAYTREPVKSAFGWHVILLLDRRADGLPPFAEMKGDLRKQMIQEKMDEVIRGLRATADIELFPEYPDAGLAGAAE